MKNRDTAVGIFQAFVCLMILGVMPIISNSRPSGFDALSFAFFLSTWQLLFSLPLVTWETISENKGILSTNLSPEFRRRTIGTILLTGSLFGASTYLYVLSVEKAGAVSAAIAMQAYPLFAIILESIFLKSRKTRAELSFTSVLLVALYFLATQGTWQIAGFSIWFLVALVVPLLWSIAHIIIREALTRTPITPAQTTFFRVLVSTIFLGIVFLILRSSEGFVTSLVNFHFQTVAMIMGLVYYLELIVWFHAMRHISVSLASTITVPWPALTMVLTFLMLGESVERYQLVAFVLVAASLYGLMYVESRKP